MSGSKATANQGNTGAQSGNISSETTKQPQHDKRTGLLSEKAPIHGNADSIIPRQGGFRAMSTDGLLRAPQPGQFTSTSTWKKTPRNRSQSGSCVENQRYGSIMNDMNKTHSSEMAPGPQPHMNLDTTIAWLPMDESVFDYQQTLFDRYTRDLSSQSRVRIRKTVAKLREVTTRIYPYAQLGVFGSLSTGFYLPNSDIDLVLQGDFSVSINQQTGEIQKASGTPSDFDVLGTLSAVLRSTDWIEHVNFIDTAKVPVLKLKTADYQCIDITSRGQEQDHSGEAARDMFREFSDKMPELLPMTLVLKQFLREQGLNHPYKGGLSSYSLTLLIIAFLQMMYHQCSKPPVHVEIDGWKERLRQQRLSRKKNEERPPAPPLSRTNNPQESKEMTSQSKNDDESDNESRGILTVDPAFDENFPTYTNNYPANPSKGCGYSLGFLLFRFLEFYGACFDYQHFGLSVRCGGFFFPLQPVPIADQKGGGSLNTNGVNPGPMGANMQEAAQPNNVQAGSNGPTRFATYQSITIEDPLFPGRNAAAASYAFASIASAFESAFFSLACFRPTRFQPTLLSCLLHKEGFTDVEAEIKAIENKHPGVSDS